MDWRNVSDSERSKYMSAKPSDGYIPRLVSHLYPSGGGYLSKHSDPSNENNVLQTLIVGSQRGKDFETGGLKVYSKNDDSNLNVEDFLNKGDMVMFDQSFDHEVLPIDANKELDWNSLKGKLSHILLFTRSDYIKGEVADVVSKI